ncbi:hypothetical protein HaLaN_32038, partial [Haematococcus lacustris]
MPDLGLVMATITSSKGLANVGVVAKHLQNMRHEMEQRKLELMGPKWNRDEATTTIKTKKPRAKASSSSNTPLCPCPCPAATGHPQEPLEEVRDLLHTLMCPYWWQQQGEGPQAAQFSQVLKKWHPW